MADPLFESRDPRVEAAVNEARMEMVTELHRAMYGDTWAQPRSPQEVWERLLDRIATAGRCFRRD
jgi:hypothetical protein